MHTIAEVRIVAVVFLVWACTVAIMATRPKMAGWTTRLVFLPLGLLHRTNPFGSPLSALVFLIQFSNLKWVLCAR